MLLCEPGTCTDATQLGEHLGICGKHLKAPCEVWCQENVVAKLETQAANMAKTES